MPQMCPKCGRDNRDTGKFCAFCQAQLVGLLGTNAMLQGRYQIVGLLGCGGMGAVYLAQDHRLGPKKVAVKENFDTSQQAQQQFQFEAHILANLDHPNLPKVTDHFIELTGRQYLVMEYVEGENLDVVHQRHPQGQLPEQQVLAWADDLLDALHYLHTQPNPVIHRDIKPANIKLTPRNKIKLVDFGIAKIHRRGQPTHTIARAGSPGFAPVEQYSGGTDARSDIYSLGATLYCLLTGQIPPASTALAAGQPLPPPRKVRPDLSPRTQALIFQAMAVNADQRLQTADEMRQALRGPSFPLPATPVVSQPTPLAGGSAAAWRAAPQPSPQPLPQPTIPQKRGAPPRLLLGLGTLAVLVVLIVTGSLVLKGGVPSSPTATVTLIAVVATPVFTTEPIPVEESPAPTGISPPTAASPTETPGAGIPSPATDTPAPTGTLVLDEPTPTVDPEMLSGLHVSAEASGQSGIRVEIRYAEGSPKRNSWVGVYRQKTDVSGNPVKDDRVASGRTDDTGAIFFALEPDTYAVELGDMTGYGWGNEFNYAVNGGQVTVLSLTLAQLVIGVRNADGLAVEGRWTGIYWQKPDVSGNPVKGDRVASGRTDNTGTIVYNLTPGIYAAEIGDIAGNLWGDEMNHPVVSGGQTTILVTLGRLTVGVKNADDQPVAGRWVGIYYQEKDLEGNPVKGDRFQSGRTDNAGLVSWDVTAGTYAVEIGDIQGNLWGDELNHVVNSGENNVIVLTLGRLTVGLKDVGGSPIEGRWVGIYYQERDLGGNPIQGDRFASGRTDNTGLVSWDLTAGDYVVEVEDVNTLLEVPVGSGATTFTDGVSISTR